MNRRHFLRTSLAAGAAVLGPRFRGAPAVVSPEARLHRPNILLILTDQQQAGALSGLGWSGVRTPAMDSLAARGLRFSQTYCYHPLCVPSRTSLMTGRAPRLFGTRDNDVTLRLPSGTPTLGRLMSGAGYETAYVGKWHVPISPTDRSAHGFGEMQAIADAGHNDQRVAGPCHHLLGRSRRQPLFLVASIINPHDICEYAAGYPAPNGNLVPPPPPDECPALPANHAIQADEPEALLDARRFSGEVHPTAGWDEGRWRQYLWGYRRFVEKADALVGRILDSLASSGRESDTLVVFASDHGEGGGAHLWNQKTVLYEESVRVPFIVAGPGVSARGQTDDRHLVSFGLDTLPTFCDYAGVTAPAECSGRSVRPLIEGSRTEWRDHLAAETEFHFTQGPRRASILGRMVRTEHCKYIAYSEGANREQFFDLAADPGERNNLIHLSDRQSDILRHRGLLADWTARHGDDFMARSGLSTS